MNKFSILAMSLFCLTASAHAASFECGNIKLSLSDGKAVVTGIDGTNGPAHGDLDSTYHPRANHAGSTRYELPDACDEGSFFAILDAKLSAGKAGNLTLENDCDTDGGAPLFNVYNCQLAK